MIYKIFPEKDATIYSEYPLRNTGLDEILEISSKYDPNNPQVSRALIQFNSDEIFSTYNTLNNLNYTGGYHIDFSLHKASFSGLGQNTILKLYPVSGSWDMGLGRYSNTPETTEGVSWNFKQSSGSEAWVSGGGDWHTSTNINSNDITGSQNLNYYSTSHDVLIDVTDTFINWRQSYLGTQVSSGGGPLQPAGFPNHGFLLKLDDEYEFNISSIKEISLKFFSRDTHTIYPPSLIFKFEDFQFNTGSSTQTIIDTSNMVVTLNPNAGEYRREGMTKFRINCRPQFPQRVFKTSSLYTQNYYLPQNSYYAIKDLDTNEFIVDFDTTYTQISADENSSYFPFYLDWLEPERYYQVLIKTIIDGETLIFDNDYYFKVING